MKRQQIRKLLLITSLLLFPITLYYFSPALIINAGLNGIINGSFIVFVLMFFLSIPFGRLFCTYLCPAGGLQECAFLVNERQPKQGLRNYIKYNLCWMAPFMVLGTKLRKFLHLPGIHIKASKIDNCISCSKCNKVYPMGIDVMSETKCGIISNLECIQCGACVDSCPKNVLSYGMIERKESGNGKRKED